MLIKLLFEATLFEAAPYDSSGDYASPRASPMHRILRPADDDCADPQLSDGGVGIDRRNF